MLCARLPVLPNPLCLFALAFIFLSAAALAQAPAQPRCAVCGVRIQGAYKIYGEEGHAVCAKCENTAARCAACAVPYRRGELSREGGKLYCRECLARMKRCSLCKAPINGEFFYLPHREGVFCADCFKKHPPCSSCGRPRGAGGRKLPDGREICRECSRSAIDSQAEADRILREIRRIVEDAVDFNSGHPFALKLVAEDDPAFRAAAERAWPGLQRSERVRENGVFTRVGEAWEIMILRSLPRELFYETLAHEYGHALHSELAPALDEKTATEGFAQWIAALVLEEKGFEGSLALMRERKDLYGEGLRTTAQRAAALDPSGAEGLRALLGAAAAK